MKILSRRTNFRGYPLKERLLVAVIAVSSLMPLLFGQAAAEDETELSLKPLDYGELHTLEEYEDPEEREAHVPPIGVMEKYFAFKEHLRKKYGFEYIVEISPQFQWGFRDGNDNTTANNELNIIPKWNFIDSETFGTGNLIAWWQHSHTIGNTTTSEFNDGLGVLSPVNGGDTFPEDNADRLQLLVWEHLLADDTVRLMLGKITSRVTFNLNRYAVGDREDFFTPMIVNNTVVPFTARLGLGAFAQFRQESWYLSGMIREADNTSDYLYLGKLDNGDWEYTAEFALTPEIPNLGYGIYRVTYDYTDSIGEGESAQDDSWSISFSFDQDIGDTIGAFLRYAYADTPLRGFQKVLAGGFQYKGPFGYKDDRIGLGGWWGEPTQDSLRDEYGLEAFYKIQLARIVELTPDLQLIFDPANDRDKDMRAVAGLRVRIVF